MLYTYVVWYGSATLIIAFITAIAAAIYGLKSDGSATSSAGHWVTVKGNYHVRDASVKEVYEKQHGAGTYEKAAESDSKIRRRTVIFFGVIAALVLPSNAGRLSGNQMVHNELNAFVGGVLQWSTLWCLIAVAVVAAWFTLTIMTIVKNSKTMYSFRFNRQNATIEQKKRYDRIEWMLDAEVFLSLGAMAYMLIFGICSFFFGINGHGGFLFVMFRIFKFSWWIVFGIQLLWKLIILGDIKRGIDDSNQKSVELINAINDSMRRSEYLCDACKRPLGNHYSWQKENMLFFCDNCVTWDSVLHSHFDGSKGELINLSTDTKVVMK